MLRDKQRINEQITTKQIRLIDEDGSQLGIVSRNDAFEKAQEKGLDLVEVSLGKDVSVCRLLDYGKYRYQQSKKMHDAKKNQKQVQLKELKLRPKTAEHDFNFKLKKAFKFIEEGNRVKVTVEFRGREMSHKELGATVLNRFKEKMEEISTVEVDMKNEGRVIFIILAPKKK